MVSASRWRLPGLAILAAFAFPVASAAYPLDGYDYTGIPRLRAQRMVQEGRIRGTRRPPGESLPLKRVDLRLLDHRDLDLPRPDPDLGATLKGVLGSNAAAYGVALLDVSDPRRPRYAELQGTRRQQPASVGKLVVALAFFQGLADVRPDVAARERLLRETVVTADAFSQGDTHLVRKFDGRRLYPEPIRVGDRATLWTYLDWMMSPSSNAATGAIQKQIILMQHFGKAYPPSEAEQERFFRETAAKRLGSLFAAGMHGPVKRNGLDPGQLRQGSFFTREGKKRVPGGGSYATARSLTEMMLRMEQGRLVDTWSSREIKRLMYSTERRVRYGSSSALRDAALYFKSGSLYTCKEEPGFHCRRYHGNATNLMNSVAVVESPAGERSLHYITTVLSNVLRKNAAQDHRDLARAIHQRLRLEHGLPPGRPAGYGRGFIGFAGERREHALAWEVQDALLSLGYTQIVEPDGVIGAGSSEAIRTFQRSQGMPQTGQPSEDVLRRMRKVAREKGLTRPGPDPD